MAKQNQSTEKETRERIRSIALKNLKESNLPNLAVAYNVQNDKNYGEHANSAVEEFLYFPSLNSGTSFYDDSGNETDLMKDTLLNSREDGKRYSGKISEYGIIKGAAENTMRSLSAIKVEDIISLLGSKVKIKESYKDKYLSELANSENKEEKEVAQTLIGGYMGYMTTNGVSSSLKEKGSNLKSGLESLVKE